MSVPNSTTRPLAMVRPPPEPLIVPPSASVPEDVSLTVSVLPLVMAMSASVSEMSPLVERPAMAALPVTEIECPAPRSRVTLSPMLRSPPDRVRLPEPSAVPAPTTIAPTAMVVPPE